VSGSRKIFIALLACGVATTLVWISTRPSEPLFEGRTLFDWLYHHVPSTAAIPPYNSPGWHKADEAIRTIGTNGIPTLLTMLRAEDPPGWLIKLKQQAARRGWSRRPHRYALMQHEEAEYAFRVLRTNAVSAVPELIKIYGHNLSPSSQRCAAAALGSIGPAARAALPVLIRDLSHTNADVRFSAITAIYHIGADPEVSVPAATRALKDSSVNVRWNALTALSTFGGRSRPAVPELLRMFNDPGMVGTHSITTQVATTLWRIAPEKVGHPFMVGTSSNFIANEATTVPIKMLVSGQRRTLIPAGSRVPVVRQYWSSDPRPRLSLFRGSDAQDGADEHLGDFEVLDVPAQENVNISSLCVIADGNIYLCARDNQSDRFLQIRRVATSVGSNWP
jgi:hypothetical protein